jgi:hypothetical protein
MALNKNHQTKIDMMNAFDVADRNTPRDSIGRASYGMGTGGLPRTPAQQAAVKKAAKVSAAKRGERALLREPNKAVATALPAANVAAVKKPGAIGLQTGSLSLAAKPIKKGLLGL